MKETKYTWIKSWENMIDIMVLGATLHPEWSKGSTEILRKSLNVNTIKTVTHQKTNFFTLPTYGLIAQLVVVPN